MTAGSLFSIGAFGLALLGFLGILVYMWLPKRFPHNCRWSKISLEFWASIGDTFVGSAFIYAVLTFWRVLSHVDLTKGSGVDPQFNLELAGYAAFWIFIPPLWFYIDYFAIASESICGIDTDKLEQYLKRTKDYADLASKVWLAVLAALYFLAKKSP